MTAPGGFAASAARALRRTRRHLQLPDDARLDAGQTAVFCKYLLVDPFGPPTGRPPDAGLRVDLARALDRLCEALPATLPGPVLRALSWGPIWQALRTSPQYRRRLLDLAAEAVWSHPLAPETCLEPRPLDRLTAPQRSHHLVVIASPLMAHELYPLAVDAFVHDADRHGRPHLELLAAAPEWIRPDGRVERILYMDWKNAALRETDLAGPLAPDSVQFLSLPPDEGARHQELSALMACPQANPYDAARLADDKAATGRSWQRAGIETPATRPLTALDPAELAALPQHWDQLVVKPNSGTQSAGVFYTTSTAALTARPDAPDLLVQQRRDGLAYRDPDDGRLRTLVLRLHAAFDGRNWQVESAYARIGPNLDTPAGSADSRSLDLPVALAHLAARQGDEPVEVGPNFVNGLRQAAEQAACIFDGLLLVGLDVVLDRDAYGRPVPVFIEANPRPMGLARSRMLDSGERGVTQALWAGIGALKPRSCLAAP